MRALPIALPRYCIISMRRGERIDCDRVSSLLACIDAGITARGYHSSPWAAEVAAVSGAHAARAAGYLLQAQIECGTLCPTTMTYGADRGHAPRCLAGPRMGAAAPDTSITTRAIIPLRTEARRLDRHGHDGKTGRLGRARQQHARGSIRATAPTGSPATSGSSRRRNATRTWCSRKPAPACRASSCRGACPMARSTVFTFSA